MPASLKELLDKNFNPNKIRIGYTDITGYNIEAMRTKKAVKKVQKAGLLAGDATTNTVADVALDSVEENGFIKDDKLKQGVLDIQAFGALPLKNGEEYFLAAPPCTSMLPGGNSGKVSSFAQCCPLTASASEVPTGDFSVGVLLNIAAFGQKYLDRFYPNTQIKAANTGTNVTPSLEQFMDKGQLWAEIVIPSSDNSASSGHAFNAKVIGTTSANDSTVYISSPICCLDLFSSCFPKKALGTGEPLGQSYTFPHAQAKYSAYDGKINGFVGAEVSKSLQESKSPATRELAVAPSATRCRVRFWIDPNAKGNQGVPGELFQRNYGGQSSVDNVTNTSNGSPIPVVTNPEAHVDVAIDVGHSKSNIGGRNAPAAFKGVDWTKGDPGKISAIMGFNRATKESVEWIYDDKVGNALFASLAGRGISAAVFDITDDDISNRNELNKVNELMLQASVKLVVSIHMNANQKDYYSTLTGPTYGTFCIYQDEKNIDLCKKMAKALDDLRVQTGEPVGGMTKSIMVGTPEGGKTLGILTQAKAHNYYACYTELAFQDSAVELLWVAEHVKQIADTMADVIVSFMQEKNLLTDTGAQAPTPASTTPNA